MGESGESFEDDGLSVVPIEIAFGETTGGDWEQTLQMLLDEGLIDQDMADFVIARRQQQIDNPTDG